MQIIDSLVVAMALGASAASAFGQAIQPANPAAREHAAPAIPRDNQTGRFLNFETAPTRPMALSDDGSVLFVLNTQGGRLVLMHPVSLVRLQEIPVGLGTVALAQRPGTDEVWVVDRVSSAVQVIDLSLGGQVRSIQVGAEPHAIQFSPDGTRAWVTCSSAATLDVIQVASYERVGRVPLPGREPRGLAWQQGRVWVTPFHSGNNTASRGVNGAPDAAQSVTKVTGFGIEPLPDRDLFSIVPGAAVGDEALDPARTVRGLGTTLFNLHARPGTSELWIPHTDARNADHKGEESFVGGQVVRNRIAIVDAAGVQSMRWIDLDAISPANVKCAQPSAIAFDPTRPRAYVAGYGSDLVAVLDIASSGVVTWAGHIDLPAKQPYPRGTAPRGVVVDAAGQTLYVYNKNDSSVVRVGLQSLPAAPFSVISAPPTAIGWEALSTEERLGRHLFTDGRNSKSKTSACASCHVDGHTDFVAWDLSSFMDPEGQTPAQQAFPVDVKGPLFTQSTRRMEDSGPYHWRGEKRHLNEFNNSFITLLDREVNGVPKHIGPEYQYLRHYINRLAIPANPRQARDRSPTALEAEGARLFQEKQVVSNLSCASCHTLPLGSRGEVVALAATGVVRSADVPGLRGVADKEGPAWDAGGTFGVRPESGAGLLHAGTANSIEKAIRGATVDPARHSFALSPQEVSAVAAFVRAFDTGLAPSTAFQITLHAGNANAVRDGDLRWLRSEAEKGNCDLVFARLPTLGSTVARTGWYDVAQGKFRIAQRSARPLSVDQLVVDALAGVSVTFYGVPRGMGIPRGVDTDNDELWDLDELAAGTSIGDCDTDGDTFIDGYETLHGTNPLVPNATTPDTRAPSLKSPAKLVWVTTNTAKLEFQTDEYCRVLVSLNGGGPLQRLPLHNSDSEHVCVLTNLEPDTDYTVTLAMSDASENTRSDSTTTFRTLPRMTVQPCAVGSLALSLIPTGSAPRLSAQVEIRIGTQPAGAGFLVKAAVYRIGPNGLPQLVAPSVFAFTNAAGVAPFEPQLPTVSGSPGKTYFIVQDVTPPAGAPPYVLAYNQTMMGFVVY